MSACTSGVESIGDDCLEPNADSPVDDEHVAQNSMARCLLSMACWNIHGLREHKQPHLLSLMTQLQLSVLAVCETHLANQEQHVQWEVEVDRSQCVWHGRSAVQRTDCTRGRGSGGVGLLVKREWRDHCISMPDCEHSGLHFIRLQLADMPSPVYIGVAYLAPIGSSRYSDNEHLLSELVERVTLYAAMGAVVVLGDFNVHIGCTPSTLTLVEQLLRPEQECVSEPLELDASLELSRRSVDVDDSELTDGVSSDGASFIRLMDSVGMVVLNGLTALGSGLPAEATFGSHSVIDFVLVDSAHWQDAVEVSVETKWARPALESDHEMILTGLWYTPSAYQQRKQHAVVASPLAVNTVRYHTNAKGDSEYFKSYRNECTRVLEPLTQQWNESD